MKFWKFLPLYLCTFLIIGDAFGQGKVTGNLQLNHNFFQRDTLIGASNTPQYDNQLSGTEGWLNLNYNLKGFNMGLRFDLFNNSNQRNPQQSFTGQGIGMWYVNKKIDKLGISAGYIYDQIGSGIAFRAFEARPLAIDNALMGLRLTYDLAENIKLKAFTGKQKNYFELYDPIVKGVNIEGFVVPDSSELSLVPGFGAVNRTIDEQSMQRIATNISTYSPVDTFTPKYNVYVFSLYNTLTYKNFSWYVEGAYKTQEAIADLTGKLINTNGNILFSTLSYAQRGFSVTLQGKRTENFTFRTSPNETLNRGIINFLPPMARQNTYRLTARYNAATQDLGELAAMVDIGFRVNKNFDILVNASNITDLNGELLYRELYTEATLKKRRKYRLVTGFQLQQYNQEVYEQKVNVPLVETFVPYVDFLYRFNRKKALRTELQYMFTDDDFGSWAHALLEYTVAPHWSFSVTDMVTINPEQYYKKTNKSPADLSQPIHFYSFLVSYTRKSNKFLLSYVKQVEGIVCTGGVCRYEPAFSGVRLGVTSRF